MCHFKDQARYFYSAMVSALDHSVDQVFRFLCVEGSNITASWFSFQVVTSLKETGQYENTIIVVTTDNGGAVKVGGNNLPLRGTKGQSKISFQVPSACASMQAPHGMAV